MILKNNKPGNPVVGLFVIITIVFLIALGPYLSLPKISTFILVPTLFIISLFFDFPFKKRNKLEFKFMLGIFILSLTSVFYAKDQDVLLRGFSSLLGAVLASYIPLGLNRKRNYFVFFHAGFIIAIIVLIVIMYTNGNFSFSDFATKIDYRDRFLLNANQYSYLSFFANTSLFYLHNKYKGKFITILLIVLPILFLIISFVTQSRSGLLIILFINTIYWFFINSSKKKSKLFIVLRNFFLIIFFSVLSLQFVDIYQNSRLKSRVVSSSQKTDSRVYLIYDSLDAFKSSPMLGVGLGQVVFYTRYGLFSHNSYVEILAEQGIPGGFLLLFLFGIPIYKCIKELFKNPNDTTLRISLLFYLAFYFYNNFYVFYKFPFSMMYFFLIISIQYKVFDFLKVNKANGTIMNSSACH